MTLLLLQQKDYQRYIEDWKCSVFYWRCAAAALPSYFGFVVGVSYAKLRLVYE